MHLEEQPGHLSGHIVYGQALFESSRPADAKRVFEAALTLDPENLIALRHLGELHQRRHGADELGDPEGVRRATDALLPVWNEQGRLLCGAFLELAAG